MKEGKKFGYDLVKLSTTPILCCLLVFIGMINHKIIIIN